MISTFYHLNPGVYPFRSYLRLSLSPPEKPLPVPAEKLLLLPPENPLLPKPPVWTPALPLLEDGLKDRTVPIWGRLKLPERIDGLLYEGGLDETLPEEFTPLVRGALNDLPGELEDLAKF